MDCKQDILMETIRKRIQSGEYADSLPKATELAEELQVNVKTLNKALQRLARMGVVCRKRHSGTRVVRNPGPFPDVRVIEVLFEGYSSIFSHPFWCGIWEPIIFRLSAAGYKAMLTMFESDPDTGLARLEKVTLAPVAGRIVLGSGDSALLNLVKTARIPFIAACDCLDSSVPQVSFDFTEGIRDAVDYLFERGCRRIGFLGQTQSYFHPQQLNKYNAYLAALQKFCQVNPCLIGNTRPVPGGGARALRNILQGGTPDALIAAYDSQMPEILEVLKEWNLKIPVIGCDGLRLPGVPLERPVVKAPLQECGAMVAEKILYAIRTRRKIRPVFLKPRFEP